MTEQTWNFAGIEAGASSIQTAVAAVGHLLDEGKGSLTKLGAVWGGSGSESYQAVQMRWNQTSQELNNALQALSQRISESGQAMAQTESGVSSMFT